MKYQLLTEFHTYESRNGNAHLDFPMHGTILEIDDNRYFVEWSYDKDKNGSFRGRYTEDDFEYVLSNLGYDDYPVTIKSPYENLDEDLFTL